MLLTDHGTVLATDDGAETWIQEMLPSDVTFTSIFSFDEATAWAVTSTGQVIATATGGR